MGKRYQVVINYQYDENWIGGTYYIQNLIHALQTLKDEDKPFLHIKSNKNSIQELRDITSYSYLKIYNPYSNIGRLKRGANKISQFLIKKNIYNLYKKFDAVFPSTFNEGENICSKIFWIPDFQEKHLPHFFSSDEIKMRDEGYKMIQNKSEHVIFSSKDAQKDFNTFYPKAKPRQYILNFATHHENSDLPEAKEVLQKFSITRDYFLCSNQFWAHKNHIVVIKAIAELKKHGIYILVVFTGKEHDYRNPDYFSDLCKKIECLGIQENVKFLGFIDRQDQIVLLKNCNAIIQPSLFEGWSTVNEDAKAENAYILSSNLEVNREQLQNYPNKRLFDPSDERDLAIQIKNGNFACKDVDYRKDITKFGETFLEIIKKVTQK